MSITGKIKTLFSDKNKTEALFPRTKVSAVSDDNGVGLNVLLEQTVPMARGGTGAENGAEGLANLFAAGSTVLSPYQYGTEPPANAAVGQVYFEEATGTIADIGQDVAKALRAVNLLDNSDFTNPVNQRGQTTYQFDSGYTIDRWKLHWAGDDCSLTVNNGYITLTRPVHLAYLFQNIPLEMNLIGKTVTVAAKVRGKGKVGFCFNDGTSREHTVFDSSEWHIVTKTITVPPYDYSSTSLNGVELSTNTDSTAHFEWAALYEGEYTAETLPPYVPKGYGAELAECQRYFQKVTGGLGAGVSTTSGSVLVFVPLPVSMRLAEPTVTFVNSLWAYTHTGNAYSLTYKSCLANQNGIRLDCASNGSTNYPVNVPDINIEISADL